MGSREAAAAVGFGVWGLSELWGWLSQVRQAGAGTGLPSGHSESAGPACCSRSSSAPQTSSCPRALWTRRCCNGSLRASPGTDTPHPVAAEREPRAGTVSCGDGDDPALTIPAQLSPLRCHPDPPLRFPHPAKAHI